MAETVRWAASLVLVIGFAGCNIWLLWTARGRLLDALRGSASIPRDIAGTVPPGNVRVLPQARLQAAQRRPQLSRAA